MIHGLANMRHIRLLRIMQGERREGSGTETTWMLTERTIIPMKKTIMIQWSCAFRTLAKHELELSSTQANP
jgi:hypothetical protein